MFEQASGRGGALARAQASSAYYTRHLSLLFSIAMSTTWTQRARLELCIKSQLRSRTLPLRTRCASRHLHKIMCVELKRRLGHRNITVFYKLV